MRLYGWSLSYFVGLISSRDQLQLYISQCPMSLSLFSEFPPMRSSVCSHRPTSLHAVLTSANKADMIPLLHANRLERSPIPKSLQPALPPLSLRPRTSGGERQSP